MQSWTAVKFRREGGDAGTVSFLMWARWLWRNLRTILRHDSPHTHPTQRSDSSDLRSDRTVRSGVYKHTLLFTNTPALLNAGLMTPQRLALLELSCRIRYLAEHPALSSRPPRVSGCLPLLVPSVADPLRLVSDLQGVLLSGS